MGWLLLFDLSRLLYRWSQNLWCTAWKLGNSQTKIVEKSTPCFWLSIRLNSFAECSFKSETLLLAQLSMSCIVTPPIFLLSPTSARSRNATLQLSSTNCMNSRLDTWLSPSESYARKVSYFTHKITCYCRTTIIHYFCYPLTEFLLGNWSCFRLYSWILTTLSKT